jgi:hypothetical protein
MVGVDDVLLRLLRLALGTTMDAKGCGQVDYSVLVEAMRRQVVPQVLRAAEVVGLADDATTLARTLELDAARRGPEAEAMAWRAHRLLADAGARPLVVKGVALAALTGRSSAERAGSDTDVLVRPADWPTAHDALVNAGYRLDQTMVVPHRRDSLTSFVAFTCNEAAYRGRGGAIDVHWRLGPGHVPHLATSALAARAVKVTVAGGEIATLDPDAALAHVALHGAKDRWQSLRTLVDAHLLVTAAGASWSAAAALTGRSKVVAEARYAVEVALNTCGPAHAQRFTRPAGDERLLAYLARRSRLTPSVVSTAAVAAKAALPPQLLVRSRLPRPVWWLMIVPRLVTAARSAAREAAHMVRSPGYRARR